MAKKSEPEKAPNHERWVISYADFTTLLLATFVVMYAVSSINSSKFQQMSESFSTAFIGRTTHQDAGMAAGHAAPFQYMPNPVQVPIVTREQQIKNLPPALRQEPTAGDPSQPQDGKYQPGGGAAAAAEVLAKIQSELQTGSQRPDGGSKPVEGPAAALRDEVQKRIQGLDATYDQLAKVLASLTRSGEVKVSLQSLGVVIDINEVLLFKSGKADLTAEALPLIDRIAGILRDVHYEIQVNGFTDNIPIHNANFESNWDLSATRAVSVVKRFVAAGIDPTLLVGAGFGEYHPVAANDTLDGRAANRRVSIVVVSPIEGSDPAKTKLLGLRPSEAGASAAPGGPAQANLPMPATHPPLPDAAPAVPAPAAAVSAAANPAAPAGAPAVVAPMAPPATW